MNGEATPAAPPNDLHLVARVKNQQGEEFGIKILARPGQSTQSILDVIGQYGYTLADPTSLQKELNPTEEGAVPKTAPEHEPFNIPGIGTMGDAAQTLAPLAFGLMTHSPAMARMAPRAMQTLRPMAQRARYMAPLGLGARVAAEEASRGPDEPRVTRALHALMRGAPGEALAASVPAGEQLERLGVGMARPSRFLPALRKLIPAFGRRQAGEMLSREEEEARAAAGPQARSLTSGIARSVRQFIGPIIRSQEGASTKAIGTLHALIKSIKDESGLRPKALLHAYEASGAAQIQLEALDSNKLLIAMNDHPVELMRALTAYASHGGKAESVETLRRGIIQTRMARIFRESLVAPPHTPYPEAFEGGRILDPSLLSKGIAKFRKELTADGELEIFGKGGVQELDRLAHTVSEATLPQAMLKSRRVERELGRLQAGGEPRKAAREPRFTLRPFGRAIALGIGNITGGTVGQVIGFATEEGIARMMAHLAGTEVGLRWIAAGLELQRAGIPEAVLIPALARSVPNVLASLQIGPSREEEGLIMGLGAGEVGKGIYTSPRELLRSARSALGGSAPAAVPPEMP